MAVAVGSEADHLHREVDLRRHHQPLALLLEGEAMDADALAVAERRELERLAVRQVGASRRRGAGAKQRDRQERKTQHGASTLPLPRQMTVNLSTKRAISSVLVA